MVAWTDEQFRKTCQDIISLKEQIKVARENLMTTAMDTKKEMLRLLNEIRSYKILWYVEDHYLNLKECIHCAVTYTKINNDIFQEFDNFEECLNNEIYPAIDTIRIVYLVREHAYLEDLQKEIEKFVKQIENITKNFEKMINRVTDCLLPIREKRIENIHAQIPFHFRETLDETLHNIISKTLHETQSLIATEDWLMTEMEDQRKTLAGLLAITDITTEIANIELN